MTKRFVTIGLALAVILALAGPVFAQGRQTGTIEGQVTTPDGEPVPGVLITAESPVLQGQRTAVSGTTGEYILRGLTPGSYSLTFELEGMTTVQTTADVRLGQVSPVNAQMQVQTQEETIVVTGELPSVLASSEVSTTYTFDEVNNLPINRQPDQIAALSPGLTQNTPNGGQVTISGGFAYDNVFLIDGVDANDNLFGNTSPVYVEDAIADIQVLTSGISAEYGRFSGGVVNVITKSGGNEFSGTLRADLTNDSWRSRTPLEKDRGTELQSKVNEVYQGTLGGYLWKDHIWFFGAGRKRSDSSLGALFLTGIPYDQVTDEKRWEVKLTGNIANRHQIQGQFTDRTQSQTRPSFSFSATPDTLRTRDDPSDLRVVRYNGVLTPSLFAELQYSEKRFQFKNNHVFTDLHDSPFFDFFGETGAHYNRPYFDGSDPEDRNNEQGAGSLSWFIDSEKAGTHDLKIGAEDFTSIRTGGNSQSSTNYVFADEPVLDSNGNIVLDSNNKAIPNFVPGASGAWNFIPTRDAKIDIETKSLYVNDRWSLNDHWSFNLGARYEAVKSNARPGSITTVDTSRLVPRLGASYDVHGDGKYRIDATYAQYSGKYSESQFASNTSVGNPPGILLIYVGPPGQGLGFDPGFDLSNYVPVAADDGTQNVFVDNGIKSPVVNEYTLSGGMELGRGGYLKVIYTNRKYNDFVEDFVTTATGSTNVAVEGVPAGTFSNTFITNSNIPSREYEGVQLIGRYRLTDNWYVQGNWTYQIKNNGNFEGEATNQPGISSVIGDYPEILVPSLHYPTGRLNDFQRNKVRLWTNYNLALGRAGNLNFGLLANYDNGRTFSRTYSIGLTDAQAALLDSLGYVDSPSSQTIYPDGRGDVTFDSALTFDLSVNYAVPIFRDVELWLKGDVINLLNDTSQIAGNSTVRANFDGPLGQFGIPLTFTEPGSFHQARNNADFVAPREYRFTVGFRF